MRRADREITGIPEKLALVEQCKVCRLGLCADDEPYIIPLNYGYTFVNDTLTLYFHSALEGRKLDIIRRNNRVCFEIDSEHKLVEADTACGHGFSFASIIGFGIIELISAAEEKTFALNILMKHQTGQDIQYTYTEAQLNAVCVYKMKADKFTGKKRYAK